MEVKFQSQQKSKKCLENVYWTALTRSTVQNSGLFGFKRNCIKQTFTYASQPQYVHLYFGWYEGACMLLFTAIVRVLEQDMGYSSIQLC